MAPRMYCQVTKLGKAMHGFTPPSTETHSVTSHMYWYTCSVQLGVCCRIVYITFAINNTLHRLRGMLDVSVRNTAALKCMSSVTGEIKIAESPRDSSLR